MRLPTTLAQLLVATCLMTAGSVGRAQERPLQTDDPQPIEAGNIRVQAGFEFLQDRTFLLSGLRGDLTRLGVIGLFVGAGKHVEFQVTGTLLNSLNIEERLPAFLPPIRAGSTSTTSVGDFTLGTKFRLVSEHDSVPALAFRFAVEMPNAGNERGLGNDETNFFASFLVGKSVGKFRGVANAGLAILGDPTTANSQNDLFTYGLAATYAVGPQWTLVAEWNGRTGPGGPGTDDQSRLRFGARLRAAGLRWDFAGVAGLADEDPETGIVIGLTYEFKGWPIR